MAQHSIICELTEAEENAIGVLATNLGISTDAFFQRFWDGYEANGETIPGAVRVQITQWIADAAYSKVASLGAAEVLSALSQES